MATTLEPSSLLQTLNAASSCSSNNRTSATSPQRGHQQREFLEPPRALKMPDSFPSPTVAHSRGGVEQMLLEHYHHAPPPPRQQQLHHEAAEETREQSRCDPSITTKSNKASGQSVSLRRTTTPADYASSLAGLLSSSQHHHARQHQEAQQRNHHSPCSAENILGITKEALRISKGSFSANNMDDSSSTSSTSSCSRRGAPASQQSSSSSQPTPPASATVVPDQDHPPAVATSYASISTLLAPPPAPVGYIPASLLPPSPQHQQQHALRLNKFVRRLHDMLQAEKDSGIVEWRRGLLVLHSTDVFAKNILPKYFNTRNFKTFRRQLNYYGFVHVRSFSSTTMGSSTTALWVNQVLAQSKVQYTVEGRPVDTADVAAVLLLKRVEPCDAAKTAEGRRARKELAIHTVEDDLGVNAKTLQLEQIRSLAFCQQPQRGEDTVLMDGYENHGSQEQEDMDVDDTDRLHTPPCPTVAAVTTAATIPSLSCRRSNSLTEASVSAVSLSSESSSETSHKTTTCAEQFAQPQSHQPRLSRTLYYHHLYSRAAAAASAGATESLQQPQDDDADDEASGDVKNPRSFSLPPKQENASAANLLLLLSKWG